MVERLPTPATTVVTGASGWLGRALIARLLDDPKRVRLRLLAHGTQDAAQLGALGDRVEVVIGDIAKQDSAERLLHGLDDDVDVIHAAGLIHPGRITDLYAVNAAGTRHVVEAALDHGVRRVVHVSSNSPIGTNPSNTDTFRNDEPYHPYLHYGRSKMEAELAVADAIEHGLDATIVRPPWFYGPFQPSRQTSFFRLVRRGRFPVIGDGTQRRSMVYIDNLVDGVIAAELTPGSRGKAYWIADRSAYTIADIVETVGRALRDEGLATSPPAQRVPALVSRLAERADRALQRAGRYQQHLHVLGELGHTIACDIGAARRDLGYEPRIELYEGMRRSIRWCVAEGLEL